MTAGRQPALYDEIGGGYSVTRRADPRVAARIRRALGDASTVLNVGAGTGAYEPRDRQVLAVEPSAVMITQRPSDAAPVIQAQAEELPFADKRFDVVMAILSDHHWSDRARALSELRRVARRRVVVVSADPAHAERFWLTREYLGGVIGLIPARYLEPGHWLAEFAEALGRVRYERLPIPHDCRDGFYGAFWRRPHAYLDQRVRNGISVFARLPQWEVERGLARLRDDLETGSWQARHADLLAIDELDLGYRLVIADR